jgi:NitT/TauT family transport system ATP-binding protein
MSTRRSEMANPIISLQGVSKVFDNQIAVRNLTFSVEPGEVVGLLGQTGAGKSTALGLILGQIKPSSGTIVVDGCDPFREFIALRGKVAVSFQSDRLIPWRTARENVELGLEILRWPKSERRANAKEWLERVKLGPQHHEKYPHQMSGGMRQRVSLARALVINPDLILLDESFSQLDHVTSKTLRADFLALVKQLRKTCVFITHRIEDALEMANRIFVMAAPGEIKLELRLADAQRSDPAFIAETAARIAAAMTQTATENQRDPAAA